ncbi:MAG: electron transfer flavoprotein subunit beta/FixA family protein [Candidatus Desulfatibia sp.]|uniref:electron transfer flavoprotein subunit beta/FixA family protein n=1 Tax=Candidatus Desulfatibia sp. TaxID=3101189 RepID=UPI002F2DF361
MVCLIKQVPDTRNITADVLREDGTVNRRALPAVVNPDDLFALEMALDVKDKYGGEVTVISMGPPAAIEVLRDAMSRGADHAILLTDKKFAGADTLATSHVLESAIRKNGSFNLIFCGRQAIDGDTAQVGPQVAEKLDIPQVTFAEAIESLDQDDIVIRRAIEGGFERIRGRIPLLVTVTNTAANPRPPSIKRQMFWKKAQARSSVQSEEEREMLSGRKLLIPVWGLAEVGCAAEICGFAGSATWIKNVENVKLTASEPKCFDTSAGGIKKLINELIDEHII